MGCGKDDAERKGCVGFLLCSRERGMWRSCYEQAPSPKGTFCPSSVLSPGWKAAGCYNRPQHRLPSLQETGLFFVILLALLPIEQQPTFFKTWREARPLVFPPGKSLGLMGRRCRVPPPPAAGRPLAARTAAQPRAVAGTPWARGSSPGPPLAAALWFRNPKPLSKTSLSLPWQNAWEEKNDLRVFNSLVAHQVLIKTGILPGCC